MNTPLRPAAPPLPNSYWVRPGEFLAGEHPGGLNDAETIERIAQLSAAGIDAYLDLTGPGERDAYVHLLPAHIEYDCRPLIDHGVPEALEQMAEIVDLVGDALRRGRRLYVHCRAGIGRTGTVVGCWLAGQGYVGEAALDQLNTLWQQCERSKRWPFVPETPQQREFVLGWRPMVLLAEQADSTPPASQPSGYASPMVAEPYLAPGSLEDRFLGALLGLAVCDALAASSQGKAPGTFAPIAEPVGGGVLELPRGGWSDETAMALCLADSLLAREGFDTRDQVERYTRWQTEGYLSATGRCVGITETVSRALGAAHFRRQMFAGSHDPRTRAKDPLTRVAPAVLYFHASQREAIWYATEAARTTCQAPQVLGATALMAASLHAALGGADRAAVLSPPTARWSAKAPPRRLAALAAGDFALRPAVLEGRAADAVDALQAAFHAFSSTQSFRAGALLVANLGGDSDAIGALYGQLAGAWYGVQAIPPEWRNTLNQHELIAGYARRLLTRQNSAF